MSTWDWRTVEQVLLQKGFREDRRTKHTFFVLMHQGKTIGIKTKLSHGSKGELSKTTQLFRYIKDQLGLQTNRQLEDFLNCPLGEEGYKEILRSQGKMRD